MVTLNRISKGARPWPSQKHDEWLDHLLMDTVLPGQTPVTAVSHREAIHFRFRGIKATIRQGRITTLNLEPGQSPVADVYADAISRNPHIAVNPNVLDGKPCIKGTRTPISLVLRYLSVDDDPTEDLDITRKDVADCLKFAATVCDQPLRHGD